MQAHTVWPRWYVCFLFTLINSSRSNNKRFAPFIAHGMILWQNGIVEFAFEGYEKLGSTFNEENKINWLHSISVEAASICICDGRSCVFVFKLIWKLVCKTRPHAEYYICFWPDVKPTFKSLSFWIRYRTYVVDPDHVLIKLCGPDFVWWARLVFVCIMKSREKLCRRRRRWTNKLNLSSNFVVNSFNASFSTVTDPRYRNVGRIIISWEQFYQPLSPRSFPVCHYHYI